eukprot:TRINITY_DN2700_c0_g1_i1.p1 TRINITY_DN2700_c0_g1~~TRINITY_DN2700_c0_g1_i1.p1  ORF type:complete len:67 (-),score=3.71 TRINITY_DN2700_c0_g1_i1:105-281(-)
MVNFATNDVLRTQKCRNDVIHQFCGPPASKTVENGDILTGKFVNPKVLHKFNYKTNKM